MVFSDTTTPSFCEEPTSAAVVTCRPFDVRRGFEPAYRVDSKSQGCSHLLTLPSKVEDVTTSDTQEQLAIAGEVFPVGPSAGAAECAPRYKAGAAALSACEEWGTATGRSPWASGAKRRTTRRSSVRGSRTVPRPRAQWASTANGDRARCGPITPSTASRPPRIAREGCATCSRTRTRARARAWFGARSAAVCRRVCARKPRRVIAV